MQGVSLQSCSLAPPSQVAQGETAGRGKGGRPFPNHDLLPPAPGACPEAAPGLQAADPRCLPVPGPADSFLPPASLPLSSAAGARRPRAQPAPQGGKAVQAPSLPCGRAGRAGGILARRHRARAERAATDRPAAAPFRCRGSMDANLRFWRAEGQSFFQRFLLWADVLDPLLLLKSSDEIRRTRLLLQNSGKTLSEPIQNDQTKQAFLLSLSSVHPDTDKIIPVLFRPPAFLPISLPLVIASSLPLRAKQTFFCQFVFHTYTTGFTLLNGNGTTKAEEHSLQQKQILYSVGAISYAACIGAFPLVFMNRYTLKSSLTQLVVRKLLPAPLLGLMSAFTVAVVRSPEFENGIEVMDRNGKVVGLSQKAGEKAVKETALSRAVLFGTTLFLPAVLMHFVERAKFAKTPHALASVRMLMITSVLAGMLPVSLSMFPQCGEIKRADLEPEILSSTDETELFYNRGI